MRVRPGGTCASVRSSRPDPTRPVPSKCQLSRP
nr:MAG TPA: hypothetical protein [Caudoviricetes sp.]